MQARSSHVDKEVNDSDFIKGVTLKREGKCIYLRGIVLFLLCLVSIISTGVSDLLSELSLSCFSICSPRIHIQGTETFVFSLPFWRRPACCLV